MTQQQYFILSLAGIGVIIMFIAYTILMAANLIVTLFIMCAFIFEFVSCMYIKKLGATLPILVFFIATLLSSLNLLPLNPYGMFPGDRFSLIAVTGACYMLPFVAGMGFWMCLDMLYVTEKEGKGRCSKEKLK